MRQFVGKRWWQLLVSLVVVGLAVSVGVLWQRLDTQAAAHDQQLGSLQANLASLDGFASYRHGVIDVTAGRVYLPDYHLALPLNDLTANLMYSPRQTGNEADVTTQDVAAFPVTQPRVRDCTGMVRFKFEAAPNPYNNAEQTIASLHLQDGRTLQVYASQLASCAAEWQAAGASPDALAGAFKAAQSY